MIRNDAIYRVLTLATLLLASLLLTHCAGTGSEPYRGLSDGEREKRMWEMYAEYAAEFPEVKDVRLDTYLEWRDTKDAVLLDARSAAERGVSRIPGALMPEEFAAKKATFKGRPVVVHCTIGYRSAERAGELAEQGFDAYNLAGGVLAWAHAGREFHTPAGESTHTVHTYGKQWDLVPSEYDGVW